MQYNHLICGFLRYGELAGNVLVLIITSFPVFKISSNKSDFSFKTFLPSYSLILNRFTYGVNNSTAITYIGVQNHSIPISREISLIFLIFDFDIVDLINRLASG